MWGNGGDFLGYNATAYGRKDAQRQYVLFVNLDEASFTSRIKHALDQASITAYCGGVG